MINMIKYIKLIYFDKNFIYPVKMLSKSNNIKIVLLPIYFIIIPEKILPIAAPKLQRA